MKATFLMFAMIAMACFGGQCFGESLPFEMFNAEAKERPPSQEAIKPFLMFAKSALDVKQTAKPVLWVSTPQGDDALRCFSCMKMKRDVENGALSKYRVEFIPPDEWTEGQIRRGMASYPVVRFQTKDGKYSRIYGYENVAWLEKVLYDIK